MITPVTLILGLGHDVGTACARYFQEHDQNVVVASPNEEAIDRAQSELAKPISVYHGGLGNMIGIRNALNAALEAHQRVDNMVIIPGVPAPVSLTDMDNDEFNDITMRDARAATLALRLFAQEVQTQDPLIADGPERQRQTGTVTFVLSLSSRLATAGKFSESVSQAAVEAVVRASAVELAADRIRVNAVSAIRPRAENNEPWLKPRTPLGRAALADEIAEAVGFLASKGAAIITGETLILDGGRLHLDGLIE